MSIRVEAAAYSSIGGRKNNEDNFYLDGLFVKREQMNQGGKVSLTNTHPLQLYAVFDGMGGGEYGEYASSYAAEQLKKYQSESDHIDNSGNLRGFLTDTSKMIDQFSLEHDLKSGSVGSTAAILVMSDWWYRTVHVGDSRIYLLRDGKLKRLTKDQSEVQRLVDSGEITIEEAWSHPRKNVITHHLGMPLKDDELESVISDRMAIQAGDCFLICSDGVNDNLRDEEIENALNDPLKSAEELVSGIVRCAEQSANERDVESDNVTAVVLKIQRVAGSDEATRRFRKLIVGQKLATVIAALSALGAAGIIAYIIQALF